MTSIVLNSPINPEQLPEVLAQLVRTARRRAHIVINLTPLSPTANTQVNALATTPNDPIVEDLLPIFGNDKQQVEQFLCTTKGAKDTLITDTVKRLVGQGIINERACKSTLFTILRKHNIYPASKSTWNDQVNFS